jgi:hypothetical protein
MASAFNDKSCDTCEFFDPVMRGQAGLGGVRETNWGWCAKKSKYPAKEGPGQKFPEGVERLAVGEPGQPFIVKKAQVVQHCTTYTPRSVKPSKADLLKQLQEKSGGGRIIGH